MALVKPNLNKPAFRLFTDIKTRVENNRCATCNNQIQESDFRDVLSKREYSISGMCQTCQDDVFGIK